MKIPKTINIAGKNVKIKIDSKVASKYGVNGTCYADYDYILLDDPQKSGISKENQEQTLIHEIIHKINNILCRDDCNGENYVNPLSELLYQAFKQLENGNR